MKYGIVAFPSKNVQDLANSYRKRYDPHFPLITPHITLRAAFEATESEAKELARSVRQQMSDLKPFEIRIAKISSFAPAQNKIYLKIEPSEELQALYKALNEGEDPSSSTPYITLAQDMTPSEHDDVYSQLRMVDVARTDTIDRVHLLYQLEDGSWTSYETFRLGGDES